jgi:hypothetical protein
VTKREYQDTKAIIFLANWDPNKGIEKPSKMEAKRNQRRVIFKLQTQVAKWKRKVMKATIVEFKLVYYLTFTRSM